ncbi:hypothetical protein WN944_026749 [Citrus x changshan-huyou]|uniref:Reverse transcriptase Ty1/copia-type domain-containing protein n=1 Tax=Citrus x changshan-huyou TaxID=2935761 RepID=A0AAP0LJI0_9ROSI
MNKENQWVHISDPNGIDLFVDLVISQEQGDNSSAKMELSNQHQMITRRKLRNDSSLVDHIALATEKNMSIAEPKSYKTAMKIPYWLEVMEDEIKALKNNDTWPLVTRPKGINVVGSKWIFKTKLHEYGTVDRFKARLVAQGYSQVHGLNYEETFSPVVKPTTIRLILALAVTLK